MLALYKNHLTVLFIALMLAAPLLAALPLPQ